MNFQKMDSLGALIEGNKARMNEDTSLLNQDILRQNIEAERVKQAQAALLNPIKVQQAQAQVESIRAGTAQTEEATKKSQQDRRRAQLLDYIDRTMRYGDLPGGDDTAAEEAGIPPDHPVRKAMRAAKQFDTENAGLFGPGETPQQSRVEQLKEALLQGEKERSAEAKDARTAEREKAKQGEMNRRNAETLASRERIAAIMAQAKSKAAQIAAAARGKNTNLEQYATELIRDAEAAERAGDATKADSIRLKADQILGVMQNLSLTKDIARRTAEAERLKVLTDGKVDITGTVGAAPPAPSVSTSKPAGGQTKSGKKYTITSTSQATTPAAPMGSGSSKPDWWNEDNG